MRADQIGKDFAQMQATPCLSRSLLVKSSTSILLSAFCLATLPVFSAFATSEPMPFGDCRSDADCAPDQYCALVMPMMCEADGNECLPPDDAEPSGICTNFEETDSCITDDDCADGFYCEVPGATCDVVCDEQMGCETFCNELQEESSGYCVAEFVDDVRECFDDSDCDSGELCHHVFMMSDDVPGAPLPPETGVCVPPDGGHCQSNADCEPNQYCNQDYGWCEEIIDIFVEPPVAESCVTDDECGPSGFCVLEDYGCPPGVACMMPSQPLGYCEYNDGPIEEPECIVAVYDECVVYAGGDQELSCDATSGAPTWLAFLAALGLIRRRKVQR